MKIIQNVVHLQRVEIHEDDYELKNRNLRIDYLLKKIDEPKFKTLLQKAEKQHMKTTEIQNIYRMVSTVSGDILVRYLQFLQNTKSTDEYNIKILDEFVPLVECANECLTDISRIYQCKVVKFTNEIELK